MSKDKMQVVYKSVDDLIPYVNNARTHSDKQVTQIAASIKEFGFNNPILLDGTNGVVAGHGRLMAAKKLKIKDVPCIELSHLSETQKKAYVLADNKLALNAGWDDELLAHELESLKALDFDLSLAGFDEDELKALSATGGENEELTSKNCSGNLSGKFMIPPFSVLNAREGWWQDRKRAWLALGMQSEIGRDAQCLKNGFDEKYGKGDSISNKSSGVSVFDPVLCEVAYRWFSPVGGVILDPFAGGSVRGIVAAKLGRKYIGHELRAEQVEANREQAASILTETQSENGFVEIKISAKMANLKFVECNPDYIENVCKGSCCQSSTKESGTMITIHPSEVAGIEELGGKVIGGLLDTPNKKCMFKNGQHLCDLHFTDKKPFGCIASPFTLNNSDTLIVRNRYKMLKCFKDGGNVPAYKNFKASLDLILGKEESERVSAHFNNGGGDIVAKITIENYRKLKDNDAIKHGGLNESGSASWIIGDSRNIHNTCKDAQADFVFSCPPYADLEVYSDNPEDLSTLDYAEFKKAYFEIIAKTCGLLKHNRFACFVVGEVRDKKGNYYNFVGDTIDAFRTAGLDFYNEAILVTAIGSLPLRAGKTFSASRKIGKTHQNILVFVKGDGKKAAEACGIVEVDESMFEGIESSD